MIGFKININDTESFVVSARSTHLFFTEKENQVLFYVSGLDDYNRHIVWTPCLLKEGDIIKIKIVDTENVSKPEKQDDFDIESIEERYNVLKIELTELGLI